MTRRGRPKQGEGEERLARIIESAQAELVERGYERMTMLGVAKRAGASKETLYARFGNREGMIVALIERNAALTISNLERALDTQADPADTLRDFAEGLLTLLLGEPSLSLNRAAMSSPELAAVLLAKGRRATGVVVEHYFDTLIERGVLAQGDSRAMFTLLFGLVVRDLQIRVLLGERPPARRQRVIQASDAVEKFLALCAVETSQRIR